MELINFLKKTKLNEIPKKYNSIFVHTSKGEIRDFAIINIYARYKNECLEMSDTPNYRILFYIPCREISKIKLKD